MREERSFGGSHILVEKVCEGGVWGRGLLCLVILYRGIIFSKQFVGALEEISPRVHFGVNFLCRIKKR